MRELAPTSVKGIGIGTLARLMVHHTKLSGLVEKSRMAKENEVRAVSDDKKK
jgi:hypothetical protein